MPPFRLAYSRQCIDLSSVLTPSECAPIRLLFMVALFHIFTAAVILVIANLRMRSWSRWKKDDDQKARLCASIPFTTIPVPSRTLSLTWGPSHTHPSLRSGRALPEVGAGHAT